MLRLLRVCIGIVIWVAVGFGLWRSVEIRLETSGGDANEVAVDLLEFAAGQRKEAELAISEPLRMAVGDPLFLLEGDSIRQVGEIRRVLDKHGKSVKYSQTVTTADAVFYTSSGTLNDEVELEYYSTPDSMAWVLETMFPPEKRAEITRELSRAIQEHHAEIIQALKPIVEDGLYDAMLVVEQDLPRAIARYRPELTKLGARYQHDVVEKEIIPLVRREIWPIVRKHAEPTARRVGMRIWARVPVWGFAWRYLYDASPLPERHKFQKEWDRFLATEAIPELNKHTPEYIRATRNALTEVSHNPRVRSAVRSYLVGIINDPELRDVVWKILREVFVDNPRLHEVLEKHWTSLRAQKAFELAANRFNPTAERIGNLMFGSLENGITPEFARVLRNQVLGKDRRWFMVRRSKSVSHRNSASTTRKPVIRVIRGKDYSVNPFVTADGS